MDDWYREEFYNLIKDVIGLIGKFENGAYNYSVCFTGELPYFKYYKMDNAILSKDHKYKDTNDHYESQIYVRSGSNGSTVGGICKEIEVRIIKDNSRLILETEVHSSHYKSWGFILWCSCQRTAFFFINRNENKSDKYTFRCAPLDSNCWLCNKKWKYGTIGYACRVTGTTTNETFVNENFPSVKSNISIPNWINQCYIINKDKTFGKCFFLNNNGNMSVTQEIPTIDGLSNYGRGTIIFYEGNWGTQDIVQTVDDGSKNFKPNKNDEIRSLEIQVVKVGCKIIVYDNPSGKTNDDWCVITVKKMTSSYIIGSFENTYEDDIVKVEFHKKNGLDGKVSRIVIE